MDRTGLTTIQHANSRRCIATWTRTETAKRAFCVAAPNVWNSLPNDIRNASSLSTFRAKTASWKHCNF